MIVGLGNPGRQYENTRHNVGFDCLKELHHRIGAPAVSAKFHGELAKATLKQRTTILLWPLTYMNESGKSVAEAARFFRVEPKNILVICDDLSLPLGKLRMRGKGSSGGQKGLGDIIRILGTDEVPRLRIGIDPTPPSWDTARYVLSKFGKKEREVVDVAIMRSADAVEHWIEHGLLSSMNAFNRSE